MKRRVGIATTLIGNPKVIILDEPTAGVDPKERLEFYRTAKSCFENKCVIISTHILDDIEVLADNIVMLSNKKIAYSGSYYSFRHSLDNRLFRIVSKGALYNELNHCEVLYSEKTGEDIIYTVIGDIDDLPDGAQPIEPKLSDIWLYYQGAVASVE